MDLGNTFIEEKNMEQACSIVENDLRASYDRARDGSLPITYPDFWLIECKGVNYYIVDLRQTNMNTIMDIIDGCAAVEKKCWKAQEDFHAYIRKCDVLNYAVINGRIVGFDAISLFYNGTTCLFSNDETMVVKEFSNRNIARNLVFTTMRWLLKTTTFESVKHFVFMSISGNPRIVNGYYQNSYLIKILFDCSFDASDELVKLMDAYRQKYKIALVHKDYPFSLKNIFPGSNTFDPTEKRYQFLEEVKMYMPKDFDHMKRGDSFAFLVKISKFSARILVFILMVSAFGKIFLSSNKIGLSIHDTR